jgi:hypothetical protein
MMKTDEKMEDDDSTNMEAENEEVMDEDANTIDDDPR